MNKSSATHPVPIPAIGRPHPFAPAVAIAAIVGVGAAVVAAVVIRTATIVVRGCERAADDGAGRKAADERSGAPVAAPARLRLLRNRDRRNGHRRGCRESCQGLGHAHTSLRLISSLTRERLAQAAVPAPGNAHVRLAFMFSIW